MLAALSESLSKIVDYFDSLERLETCLSDHRNRSSTPASLRPYFLNHRVGALSLSKTILAVSISIARHEILALGLALAPGLINQNIIEQYQSLDCLVQQRAGLLPFYSVWWSGEHFPPSISTERGAGIAAYGSDFEIAIDTVIDEVNGCDGYEGAKRGTALG